MVKLITVTEDEQGEQPLEQLEFDPIPIGETKEKKIFVQNKSGIAVTIDPQVGRVDGSGTMEIKSSDDKIEADEIGELTIEAQPVEMEEISGISAEIVVNAKAIVRPGETLNQS